MLTAAVVLVASFLLEGSEPDAGLAAAAEQITFAPATCEDLDGYEEQARVVLDALVAGRDVEISARKTLEFTGVRRVAFNGCRVTVRVLATMHRQIRQDAVGNFRVRGSISVANGEVCIRDTSVDDVNLSHLTGLGERVYALVANHAVPDNTCFSLPG